MSTFMSWLFHDSKAVDSSAVARTSRLSWQSGGGRERRMMSSATDAGTSTDVDHFSVGALFVDLEDLTQDQSALLAGLTPVPALTALVSFIGTGITAPHRCQDAAEAFSQLRLMAPAGGSTLVQVFRQNLREQSKGDEFLYIHFAGDPLSFGCLICTLTGGGFMAGWTLN